MCRENRGTAVLRASSEVDLDFKELIQGRARSVLLLEVTAIASFVQGCMKIRHLHRKRTDTQKGG
jgi:hypothetical protein